MLDGDASADPWFREIHVPQAWRVYLATGLDFCEKIVLLLSSYVLYIYLYYVTCHPQSAWVTYGRMAISISNNRDSVLSWYPNTEKRVENAS